MNKLILKQLDEYDSFIPWEQLLSILIPATSMKPRWKGIKGLDGDVLWLKNVI